MIDVGGCESLTEATQHLTSTLQISSEFWKGMNVDLNLGNLALSEDEVAQIMSIAREVGVEPAQVFASSDRTRNALAANNIRIAVGSPMSLKAAGEACLEAGQLTLDLDGDAAPAAAAAGENAPATAGEDAAATRSGAEQKPAVPGQPAVLYLRQTLRSGQAVSHKGHLVIVGDVNPGAEVIAEGDITVWGALRGMAHAGTNGNTQAEIRALRLQPIQIRIAHAIARAPDRPRSSGSGHKGPETARIVNGQIRIAANNPD